MKKSKYDFFMEEALKEAKKSFDEGGYGIGAVLVLEDKVISRGKPKTHFGKYPSKHAEVVAIESIRETEFYTTENRRKMILVTTLEPCPLCYSTALLEGIGTIVYGLADKLSGWTPDKEQIPPIFRHLAPKVIGGVLEDKCRELFEKNRKELDKRYVARTLFK